MDVVGADLSGVGHPEAREPARLDRHARVVHAGRDCDSGLGELHGGNSVHLTRSLTHVAVREALGYGVVPEPPVVAVSPAFDLAGLEKPARVHTAS